MRVQFVLVICLLVTSLIASNALAQERLYSKAHEISELLPERLHKFTTDPVLLTRDENQQHRVLSIEQMYYRNGGEVVTVILRDFSENQGLYRQESGSIADDAPEDIRVLFDFPYRYRHSDEHESIAIFLDHFTSLEIIHENRAVDYNTLIQVLESIDIEKLNDFEGLN